MSKNLVSVEGMKELEKALGELSNAAGKGVLRRVGKKALLQVIDAVDPIRLFESCPIGLEDHKNALCPLHRKLNLAAGALEDCLRETSLADLILEETQEESARNGTAVDLRCSAKPAPAPQSPPAKPLAPDEPPKRYDAQDPSP